MKKFIVAFILLSFTVGANAQTLSPLAGGSGTVTTASVVTANGFAGTVASPTTAPAFTLTTGVTGVVKGNGTAFSAAVAGTDYSVGTSALATGIVKSTTATGALSTAVAADFPTLNQNTTGSAASLSGATFAAPGAIGGTTPSTIVGTTVTANTTFISPTRQFSSSIAVGSLPACNSGSDGASYEVNNALSPVWNAGVAAGGTKHVMVMCDSATWTVQ